MKSNFRSIGPRHIRGAVTLNRPYAGYLAGATVVFPDDTESALIAQGLALAAPGQPSDSFVPGVSAAAYFGTVGGNRVLLDPAGQTTPTIPQGQLKIPNVPMTAFAALGTSAVHVAGTWYRAEINIPAAARMLATGIGVLNGATVGTDNIMVALYDATGALVANSAVAGAVSAGANAFQEVAFTTPVQLNPGRYFLAVQCNGTTATTRKIAAVQGGFYATASAAGAFGTVPASFVPPVTFTADVGPIGYIY